MVPAMRHRVGTKTHDGTVQRPHRRLVRSKRQLEVGIEEYQPPTQCTTSRALGWVERVVNLRGRPLAHRVDHKRKATSTASCSPPLAAQIGVEGLQGRNGNPARQPPPRPGRICLG